MQAKGATGAILFTGGKDSVYTLHLLKTQIPISRVKAIIINPSLPYPNPHAKNMKVVREIAKLLGRDPVVVGPEKVEEAMVEAARGSEVLAAGDIYLLDHARWLESIARKAGVPTVYEPLFNRDTRKLIEELTGWGLEFTVIGVGSREYRSLIGMHVTRETLPQFLKEADRLGIDPMGEFAEYHTLVNKVPGHQWRITYKITGVREEKGWLYATVTHRIERSV